MNDTNAPDLAIIGLGVMGENLALNFCGHGFAVSGFDLDEAKRDRFARRTGATAPRSLRELVAGLATPRVLLVMASVVTAPTRSTQPAVAAAGRSDRRSPAGWSWASPHRRKV